MNQRNSLIATVVLVSTTFVADAAGNAPWCFRHYRFKIDDCMGGQNGVQLSEFRLLNGDTDVTPLRSGFSHGEGMDSSSKSPIAQAVDGKLSTKWYSVNGAGCKDMTKCWLQIDYDRPQPVTAYDWATANDRWFGEKPNDHRDPMIFRLLGSDNGETWTELDARNIGAKNIKRNAWTGPYSSLHNDSFTAHSMLTRDGWRMISRKNADGATVHELVPTNRLPANLPPVREWKFYGIKATHTDIGLHNPQYIQRHGTVRRIDEAARLIDADRRPDSDPAAYRYVMEGAWFWDNYHMDKGMDAAWRIVTNYMARGRMDVGVTCAGNHTHLYSATEIDRSILTKRRLEQKWGVHTRTFIMPDSPGLSCSLIDPYVRAGIRNCVFLPNQWNPIPSTIWKMRKKTYTKRPHYNSPDMQGGGNRIAVSYDLDIPMVFRWKAPGGKESLLVWCSTHYRRGYERLGLTDSVRPSFVQTAENQMPEYLEILERKYPYDVWLGGMYGDDEWPNTGFADFAAKWNKKWLWPQFRTVGRLDEPFEYLEEKFGDKIPTLTGEMTSGWLQHAASTPELLADKLNADRMLETAERLGTFAGTIDRAAVDRAWWYLILNDEHSYGTSGYKGRRVFETWMQHRDWIERAAATASNELAKAVAKLGLKKELFTNDNCHNCSQITNINSTRSTCSTRLKNLREAKDGVTENRWYRVVVTNGVIYSIYDKELARELIDGPANRFMYTRDNHKTWEAEPEKALGAKVTRRVYLAENEKRIDIKDRFEHASDLFNTNRYYRFGYLAFPFAVSGGAFRAHLNGTVIRPYEDCHPMTTDAYCAVRDWCLVENNDFGVALMMRDSTLTEFGEIHPDKTCYTGKPPKGKTSIYPYLFTDWLQMHQPDGDSMNFTFRFAITSYAGRWETAGIPRICEDWLDPYAKWMRENNVPHVARETIAEPPPGWTGLIEKPRAGHGEKDGQMYVLWGAEMSPDFDHYELWRDGLFLANVTNEVPDGVPYRVARYEDLGLPTHSRHEYRIRKVWKDGRKDPLGEPFYGLTRAMNEETQNGIICESSQGRLYVRYDGATVTSWQPTSLGEGKDMFFMPATTPWGKEVHGGLPICWPWVGRREGMPKHGLVRYMKWQLVKRLGKNGVELETASTPKTMKIWPHPFTLRAVVSITGPDTMELVVTETNTGDKPYESALGFHPYFSMADACKVLLDGNVLPLPWVMKEFAADGKSHRLDDPERNRSITVSASGNDTWYVWNPGTERTPLCETLTPDEWRRFYCLEPVMKKSLPLAPGKSRSHQIKLQFAKAGVTPANEDPSMKKSEPIYAKYRLDAKSNLYPVGGRANVEAYVADKYGRLATNGVVDVWVDDGWTNVVWQRTVDLAKEPRIKMEFSRSTPGSLRIYMKGRDIPVRQRMERMIFGMAHIEPFTPCPDDFESYWRSEQARLEREVPIAVEKVPAPELDTPDARAFRVSFATFGGHRVYGILSVPKGKGRFPVIVNVPGAGPGQQELRGETTRKGWITLMMNVHGIPLYGTKSAYMARFKKWFEDYATKAGEPRYQYVGYSVSREAPFYHRTILGMTRALDWLANEPYADPSRFVYYGCSQGGGFGLYLTAMWGRFAKSLILCPNKCDMLAYKGGRQPGSSHIMNQKPENRERAEKNAVYHDNCNFATMIHTPVRMVYGTADDNCQTIGGIAAFNRIASKDKQLRLLSGKGHGWLTAGFDQWLFEPCARISSATP